MAEQESIIEVQEEEKEKSNQNVVKVKSCDFIASENNKACQAVIESEDKKIGKSARLDRSHTQKLQCSP